MGKTKEKMTKEGEDDKQRDGPCLMKVLLNSQIAKAQNSSSYHNKKKTSGTIVKDIKKHHRERYNSSPFILNPKTTRKWKYLFLKPVSETRNQYFN
jgi:hypothetical protein